jgi:predicted O-linked N-acetylglucosamine transferase (SPINDLY family)
MMNPIIGNLLNLVMGYLQQGDFYNAHRLLDQAIKLAPKNSEVCRLYGVLLAFKKDRQQALRMFDRSIKIDPTNWLAHSNRGNVLKELHQHLQALKNYDTAIYLQPTYAEAHNNRANLLKDLRRVEEALIGYEKAIELNPSYAGAYGNLGNALQDLDLLEEAARAYQKSIALGGEQAVNIGALIRCKMRQCDWTDFTYYVQKIENAEKVKEICIHPFNLLSFIESPFLIHQYTKEYIKSEYPDRSIAFQSRTRAKTKKIKVGYFSPDFKNHPVSFLISGVIEKHAKDSFELIAFSLSGGVVDVMRKRLEVAFDSFVDVSQKSDFEIAQLSKNLDLDIAIDLGGLTKDARPGIFAFRAAPIQIGYIGYLGTMGANYYDYLIADKTIIPEKLKDAYSEKIIYLPSYQANDSKNQTSHRIFSRKELGLPEQGIIYCCFNNSYKITPTIFDVWMKILSEVEGSILYLYAENNAVIENLKVEAEARGIRSDRLFFSSRLDREDYFARYRVADLFLDTSPYNAGTVASDALWTELPVLTFLGQTFSARMSGSIINAVGLPELVTSSLQEYQELAIYFGKNPQKLKEIKNKLAQNKYSMPLFDTETFTRNLELALIKVFERNELGLAPEHIYSDYE